MSRSVARRAPPPRGSPLRARRRRDRPAGGAGDGVGRAGAAPVRRRAALAVRHAVAAARPGEARWAQDRDRLPLAAASPRGRAPPGAGRCRGRAGLPLDRQPRGVHRHLRPAAARPWAAARGQPRNGRLGADRLPEASEVLRRDLGREVPERRGRLRAPDRTPLRLGRPVRDRLRGARPGRGDPRAAPGPGRPVRRLLRHILRAVVHLALPGAAAFRGAGLLVSGA